MSTTGRPVTERRIMTVLDRHGLHYGTDDDGRIGSFHAGHLFRVECPDGGLTVRARWHRSVAAAQAPDLHGLLRQWNGTEPVRLTAAPWGARFTVDALARLAAPLTDAEIRQHLTQAMSAAHRAFEALDRRFGTRQD